MIIRYIINEVNFDSVDWKATKYTYSYIGVSESIEVGQTNLK